MRRDRRQAAAADERDAAALGLDAPARLRVVGRLDETPPRRRGPAVRASPGRPRGASRPGRSATRSPSGAQACRARRPPARPRRDRARHACATACRCCRGAARSRASARARAAARAGEPKPSRSASPAESHLRRTARRGDPREAGRRRPRALGVGGGHVLGRVDGNVDPPLEQRLLELLDEDAAGADLAEGPRAIAVARRGDRHERNLDALPTTRARAAALRPAQPG